MAGKLAIDGGHPVRLTVLPYGRQWIDDDDVESVVRVLRSPWLTTGPAVAAFEESFAAAVGARFAVAVSNGTAALHAAAFAARIQAGDEVIVTPLTFAASANCVRYQGGHVVFSDVDPATLNLDVSRAERAITQKTKAIVSVDFAGLPCDLAELRSLADAHDLTLIDDAAHALGATYRGRPLGSQAHLTTYSLHPVKSITAGEGGVITTQDEELAMRMRRFRSHGVTGTHRDREAAGSWFYEMVELGYNYRLTDIQCALAQSVRR